MHPKSALLATTQPTAPRPYSRLRAVHTPEGYHLIGDAEIDGRPWWAAPVVCAFVKRKTSYAVVREEAWPYFLGALPVSLAYALIQQTGSQMVRPPVDLRVQLSEASTVEHNDRALQIVQREVDERLKRRLPIDRRTGRQLWPYEFQRVGVAYAKLNHYRCLIGDAPGLGKTIQALCSIAVDPSMLLPAVVVAPSSVLLKWKAEVVGDRARGKNGWLPTVPVHILAKGGTELPPDGWKGIILCTWGLLHKHARKLVNFGVRLFVGDEAHVIKDPYSQRSQAARYLGFNVPHVLFLSGTALKNRTMELHNALEILDTSRWGTREQFREAYTVRIENPDARLGEAGEYTGVNNAELLRENLRYTMVRRLKSQVLKELPEKSRFQEPVELMPAELQEYERAKNDFRPWLVDRKIKEIAEYADANEVGATELDILKRAEQAADRAMKSEPLLKTMFLRQLLGIAKARPAAEFIEALVSQGEPVVAFCEHHEVVRRLQAELDKRKVTHVTIGGGDLPSKIERDRRVNDFQAGKYDVFIGTQAVKEGVDLFRASNLVFVERFWSPADEEQAEDRIHRIGQKNGATIWNLFASGTIDERINEILEAKREISNTVVGGEVIEMIRREMSLLASVDIQKDLKERARKAEREASAHVNVEAAAIRDKLPKKNTVFGLVFKGAGWTVAEAQKWAETYGYEAKQVMPTSEGVRIYVRDQHKFIHGTFRTFELGNGVILIVGTPANRRGSAAPTENLYVGGNRRAG